MGIVGVVRRHPCAWRDRIAWRAALLLLEVGLVLHRLLRRHAILRRHSCLWYAGTLDLSLGMVFGGLYRCLAVNAILIP